MTQMVTKKQKEHKLLHHIGELGTSLTFDDVQLEPQYSELESRSKAKTDSQFTKNYRIDRPIIAAPMDSVCESQMAIALWELGCVGVIHRFLSVDEQVDEVRKIKLHIGTNMPLTSRGHRDDTPVVCAAIGVSIVTEIDRAHRLVAAGANVLVIDVAHGHHKNVERMIKTLRSEVGGRFDIVAGNIATTEAAMDLEAWGADALRVGIGGGSVCETRIRTGVGIPQLSAVDEITSVATVPVISDGGIRYPGDVAKALAVGANTVMIGSLLAGTDEAPGDVYVAGRFPNNKNFKMYRGSASASIKMQKNGGAHHVEGASKMVEAKGPVKKIIETIMDGVTSSMSYIGVEDVEEMWQVARFIGITNAGLVEAHPHLL